jgi:hypothetical protein
MLSELKIMKSVLSGVVTATAVILISGCTTLHTAAAKGNIKAIDRLITDGEDVNALDDSGQTSLIQAINVNQQGSVNSLLKSGANVNKADSISGNTPLHHAILQGNSKLVALLLSYNADITIQNHDKKTPVDFAHESSREEINRLINDVNQKLLDESKFVIDKVQHIEISKVEKNDLEPSKNEPTVPLVTKVTPVAVQEDIVINKIPAPSITLSSDIPKDAEETLKGMIHRHETRGIRSYLDKYPQAIALIKDLKQQFRYIGPSGWRVIDIVEKMEYEKMQDKTLIEHIKSNGLLYKKFTQEEIAILLRYGFSHKVINAMMQVN